jgi:hypothetical protein
MKKYAILLVPVLFFLFLLSAHSAYTAPVKTLTLVYYYFDG